MESGASQGDSTTDGVADEDRHRCTPTPHQWRSAQSAALRVAQNELDLRLLHQPVVDVELAKLALWARQLPIDVAANDTGFVLADVAALDRVWERTRHGMQAPEAVDGAMQELRRAADAEDLLAVERAATALTQAVGRLLAR